MRKSSPSGDVLKLQDEPLPQHVSPILKKVEAYPDQHTPMAYLCIGTQTNHDAKTTNSSNNRSPRFDFAATNH